VTLPTQSYSPQHVEKAKTLAILFAFQNGRGNMEGYLKVPNCVLFITDYYRWIP